MGQLKKSDFYNIGGTLEVSLFIITVFHFSSLFATMHIKLSVENNSRQEFCFSIKLQVDLQSILRQ